MLETVRPCIDVSNRTDMLPETGIESPFIGVAISDRTAARPLNDMHLDTTTSLIDLPKELIIGVALSLDDPIELVGLRRVNKPVYARVSRSHCPL